MPAKQETCDNCGKPIGKLEQAQVWNDSVVCVACRRALEAESLPVPTQPKTVQVVSTRPAPPVVQQQPHVVVVQQPQPVAVKKEQPQVIVIQQPQAPAPSPQPQMQPVYIQNTVAPNFYMQQPRAKRSGVIATLGLLLAFGGLFCAFGEDTAPLGAMLGGIGLLAGLLGFVVNILFKGRVTTPAAAIIVAIVAMVVAAPKVPAFNKATQQQR